MPKNIKVKDNDMATSLEDITVKEKATDKKNRSTSNGYQREAIVHDNHLTTKDSRDVNVKALEQELKNIIQGEVRFDDGSRAMYATDASNYRQVPLGVVLPSSEEDVINTINICKKY